MSNSERSNGKRRDWPQLEAVAFGALAAGSATDPAQATIVASLPDLTKRWLPTQLGEQVGGNLPNNRHQVSQCVFVSQAAANTAGNATNYATLRLDAYRAGVNQGTIAYYPLNVATTLGTAATAGGAAQTVTPASMAGIVNGMALGVDSGGAFEVVYPFNATATTFSAYFVNAHAGSAAVTSILVPYLPIAMILATAVPTSNLSVNSITAGAARTVTPTTIFGVHVGDYFLVDTVASGVQETVQILTVNPGAGTCTATFANSHLANVPMINTTKGNNASNSGNTVAAPTPFVLNGGDVLAFTRLSNNATGIATPAGMVQMEWTPAGLMG